MTRIHDTTNATIDTTDPLNAIIARYPQALPVMKRFGLDTCCGGALPLRTAAQHHDLDLAELLAALRAAIEEERL
jgi:iron-sulfur cluster repair protein YtfE (RIC family)